MKKLLFVLLATMFANAARAESTFVCRGQNNLMAHLKISEPRVKNGSYKECNGGVGDEMTNCHSSNYQIRVRDAVLLLTVNGHRLRSQMELTASRETVEGSDILVDGNMAIHMNLNGTLANPILKLKFMAKRTPGNPLEVGRAMLKCQQGIRSNINQGVNSMQPVYKILRQQEWNEFQSQGHFNGSADDLKDGFIHLSPADQVDRVINKYFSTEHPVYIVKFDNVVFLKRLVWEPASDGNLYPHLYGSPLLIHEVHSFEVRN